MFDIKSQKVGPSDCCSLGSNRRQSCQSAKVSIGITVDKSPTVVSDIAKENAPALHLSEIHSPCNGGVVGNQCRPHGEVYLETAKVELKGQKNLECLPSKSSCFKPSSADASRSYVNQLPVLPSVDSTHKKVDELTYEHDRERSEDACVDQGLSFVSLKKTNLLDQDISGEATVKPYKSTTDGLKMKLWEILGGAPSQKEHSVNSIKLDGSKENISLDYNRRLKNVRASRPKPSSDPIETDSDSPNQTVRRPTTRLMTRNKIPKKIGNILDDALNNGKNPLSSTCSDYKLKAEENLKGSDNEKIFFSFGKEDQRMQNQSAYAKNGVDIELRKISGSSSDKNPNVQTDFKFNEKEDIFSFAVKSANGQFKRHNEKKNAAIEKTIYLPTLSSSMSNRQKNEKEKSFTSAKLLQSMNEIEASPCMPCPSKKQSTQPKLVLNDSQNSQMNAQNLPGIPLVSEAVAHENTESFLLKKEKRSWEHVNSSAISKLASQHEKATCSPVTNSTDTSDDLQSPTLAVKLTQTMPSRPSNEIAGGTLQSRKLNFTWNLNSSDIIDNNKPRSGASEVNTESSHDTREVYESRDVESTFADGNETKDQLPLSPKARHGSDCFGAEELKIKGFRQTSKWFPSFDSSDNSPLKLHKRRRVHGPKDAKLKDDESDDLHEASEQCVEDSIARAVSQLALALRRINSKIQLHSNKKCCEILSTVAEKIKQQLQDVDSKINGDMGKLNGASKSKRKHLESQFEEDQERLKLIHEKYKEEFNHYLLNCSGTLEQLEAQNVETKVTAERQKVLHRKLLLQIEETMKDQLNAAETSITAIRKDARTKLNSLKFALKEWLRDGTIS